VDQPITLALQGNFYKVPIVMGTVQNESLIFLENAMRAVGVNQLTEYEYGAIVIAFFGAHGLNVLFQYPAGNNQNIIL